MAIVKAENVEAETLADEIAQEADNVAAAAAAILTDGTTRGLDFSWSKIRADSFTLLSGSEEHAWAVERVRRSNLALNETSARKKVIKNRIKALELVVNENEYEKCVQTEKRLNLCLTPVFEEDGTELMGLEVGIADLAQVALHKEKLEKKIEKAKRKLASTSHVEDCNVEDRNVEELLKNERVNYDVCKAEMKIMRKRVKANQIALTLKKAEIEMMRAQLPILMRNFTDKCKWAVFVELTDLGVLLHFLQFIEQKKVGATHLIFTLGRSFRGVNTERVLEKVCEVSNGAFPRMDSQHLYKVSTTGDGIAQFSILSDEEMTALGFKH